MNGGSRTADLPRDEVLTATRRLVVVEDAIDRIETVRLAVDTNHLRSEHLSRTIRTDRLERRFFILG